MASAAMKELIGRITDIKNSILYENALKVADKKIMNSWFRYFDQNLKGIDGHDVKLTLFSAFKTMADKGVLMPPFNLEPHHKDQKIKGPTQLVEFDRKYHEPYFKKKVQEYKESLNKPKQKVRPKTAPAGKRETKTVVTNKKVVEDGAERTTTISTTLEVITQDPESVMSIPQEMRPQTKKEKTTKIIALEDEIRKAAKKLPSDQHEKVEAWINAFKEKLKLESDLDDRFTALKALKMSLGANKLLTPFDNVPQRGKLNVREFMKNLNLEQLAEKVVLEAPVVKKTVAESQKDPKEKTSRPETVPAPHLRRSKTTVDTATDFLSKKEKIYKIKELEDKIRLTSQRVLTKDRQDMVEAWITQFADKLKLGPDLDDRFTALTALEMSLGAKKLVAPFDNVPERGKLDVRGFISKLDLDHLAEQISSEAPVATKKVADETGEKEKTARPKTAKEAPARPQIIKRSKTTVDAATGVVLKKQRHAKRKDLEDQIRLISQRFLTPDQRDMVEAWITALTDKLKLESDLENRIFALTALLTSLGGRKLFPPFDKVPARGKLNVKNFLESINMQELEEKAAPPKKRKKTNLSNPLVKNDAIQAVVTNMGKAMNAVCNEDLEALEAIPTIVEQVNHAVSISPFRAKQYKFTPFELHDPQIPTYGQRLYDSSNFEDIEDLEVEEGPNLNKSLYDDNDEEPEFLVPGFPLKDRDSEIDESIERHEFAADIDPAAFISDGPEFNFIPLEIKAYIRRLVKKKLYHWPAFLRDLAQTFKWPSSKEATEIIELMKFSPN